MNRKLIAKLIIINISIVSAYIVMHETIHSMLFRNYSVGSSFGLSSIGFYTSPNRTDIEKLYYASEDHREYWDLMFLQNLAEIIGYNMLIVLTIGAVLISMKIIDLEDAYESEAVHIPDN